MNTVASRVSEPLTFIMEIFLDIHSVELWLWFHRWMIKLTIFSFITFSLLIKLTHHCLHGLSSVVRGVIIVKIEKAVIFILKFHVIACLILFYVLAIIRKLIFRGTHIRWAHWLVRRLIRIFRLVIFHLFKPCRTLIRIQSKIHSFNIIMII